MTEEKQIGRYKILSLLGSGSYAEVYKAMDVTMKRLVALKLLKPVLIADEDASKHFFQEAQLTSQLFHPHIATTLDMGESEGRYFIALRYIDGKSLNTLIEEQGSLPWDDSLQIIRDIGGALDFAHKKGLIHRDVKPQNIIISSVEGAVLTDFGLVKAIESTGAGTRTGTLLGTPEYIAPEIWKGEPASPASDQYSLACVLVEMLTGKTPFHGSTPWEIMQKHASPINLATALPPILGKEKIQVIGKALYEDPDGRFESIRTFLQALENVSTTTNKKELIEHKVKLRELKPKKVFQNSGQKPPVVINWLGLVFGLLPPIMFYLRIHESVTSFLFFLGAAISAYVINEVLLWKKGSFSFKNFLISIAASTPFILIYNFIWGSYRIAPLMLGGTLFSCWVDTLFLIHLIKKTHQIEIVKISYPLKFPWRGMVLGISFFIISLLITVLTGFTVISIFEGFISLIFLILLCISGEIYTKILRINLALSCLYFLGISMVFCVIEVILFYYGNYSDNLILDFIYGIGSTTYSLATFVYTFPPIVVSGISALIIEEWLAKEIKKKNSKLPGEEDAHN